MRNRLLEIIREQSYEEREVTLVSGRKSNFYVDGKQTTLHPEGAYLVGKLCFQALEKFPQPVEGVGGVTLGADPMVAAITVISHQEGNPIPAFIIRKEPKKHGTSQWIEGKKNIRSGARVVIIEDVVTTGGSSLRAVQRTEEEGFEVAGIITLVDREEGGRENIEEKGYQLVSIFTKRDIQGH